MSFFASVAHAAETGLVSCGGLDCGVCEILKLVSQLFNWLLSLSAAAAILMLVIGGFLYLGARGDENRMEQAKNIIVKTLIGFGIALLAWLVIHSAFKVMGVKGSWWNIECQTITSVSANLPTKRPAEILRAVDKGGELSAVLPATTTKEELLDVLTKLPEGATFSIKSDEGDKAETIVTFKKENGQVRVIEQNQTTKPGSMLTPLIKEADADTTTSSNTIDLSNLPPNIQQIINYIIGLFSQKRIFSVYYPGAYRHAEADSCLQTGGSWYRFLNGCEFETQRCGYANTCGTDQSKIVTDGCKCAAGTCLQGTQCVSVSSPPTPATCSDGSFRLSNDASSCLSSTIEQNCAGSGGSFLKVGGLVNTTAYGNRSCQSNEVSFYHKLPIADANNPDNYYCQCPLGTCLDQDNGTCIAAGTTPPSPISSRSRCETTSGKWQAQTITCGSAWNSERCTPYVYNCPTSNSRTEYGCNCPDAKCYDDSQGCIAKPNKPAEQVQCESSGGSWASGVCTCPNGTFKLGNSCILYPTRPPESRQACENSGGTWQCTGWNAGGGGWNSWGNWGGNNCGCLCPSDTSLDVHKKACNPAVPISPERQKCQDSGGGWLWHPSGTCSCGNTPDNCRMAEGGLANACNCIANPPASYSCRCPVGQNKCYDESLGQCRPINNANINPIPPIQASCQDYGGKMDYGCKINYNDLKDRSQQFDLESYLGCKIEADGTCRINGSLENYNKCMALGGTSLNQCSCPAGTFADATKTNNHNNNTCYPPGVEENCTASGGQWFSTMPGDSSSSPSGNKSCLDGSNIIYRPVPDSNSQVKSLQNCSYAPSTKSLSSLIFPSVSACINPDYFCKCPAGNCLNASGYCQGGQNPNPTNETTCRQKGGIWGDTCPLCTSVAPNIDCILPGTSAWGMFNDQSRCLMSGGTWGSNGCCPPDGGTCSAMATCPSDYTTSIGCTCPDNRHLSANGICQ
jgi:hypothetical protein